jgi:2'-5' RNA ligase
MSEQLSFLEPEVSRPAAERDWLDALFFALVPAIADLPWIVDLVKRLRAELGLRGELLSPECLHVSLFGLGVYSRLPKEIVATAKAVGAEVSVSAFDMILDRAMTFPRHQATHAFVLYPSDEIVALTELHKALKFALRRSSLKKWATSSFTPHMTLLYDEQIVSQHVVETVRWRVSELVLVHSLRRRGPNRHIHLARWPLR